MRPLERFLVVEAAQRIAGPLGGLHLGLLGAEVMKVEAPDGDVARRWGSGAAFALLNQGKRFVTHVAGDGRLEELLSRADAAVVDSGPTADVAREMVENSSTLRSVVVIEDGQLPGGFGSSETTAQAALAFTGYVGDPDGMPARIGADLGSAAAGIFAVQAVLAGVLANGEPTVTTVSVARALATLKTIHFAGRSDPAEWEGYHVTARDRPPDQGHRAADGRLSFEFAPNLFEGWREYCRWLGVDDLVEEVGDDWYATVAMGDRSDWARSRYEAGLSNRSRDEAVERARELGGWAVPFLTPAEVLRHPQTALYGALSTPAHRQHALLRRPWKIQGVEDTPVEPQPIPPPGAHNDEVFTQKGGAD